VLRVSCRLLQNNPISLQRNSNITATEFRQLQQSAADSVKPACKIAANAASGRQRQPSSIQFLGASAAHPAATTTSKHARYPLTQRVESQL
jgi:hypothetical protein